MAQAAGGNPLAIESQTMREIAYQVVDMLIARLEDPERDPVLRSATRDETERRLGEPPPEHGVAFEEIITRLQTDILPLTARYDHPGYLAFVPGFGTWPAALGDFIASACNLYGGSWKEGAGPSQVELTVLDWFKEWIGYPRDAAGILTSGGSAANMTAMACARESLIGAMTDDVVIYLSDQAHASLPRAARILGFRPEQVRVLPTDDRFRMRPDALAGAIAADRKAGRRPLFVAAAAGSTNTGAVDPFAELSAICRREGAWLHVDAAYGGFTAITDRGRQILEGIALADSVTLDPHKWLYQPFECGSLLVKDGAQLRRAFEIAPDYLKDLEIVSREVNFADLGMQQSRMCRAIKVWMSLKYFGVENFRLAIDRAMDLAHRAEERIKASDEFELLCPVTLSVVCFRRRVPGADEATHERVNRALLQGIEDDGQAWLSSTRLRGRYALRMCVLNHTTEAVHIDRVLDWLAAAPIDGPTVDARTSEEYDRHPGVARGRSADGATAGSISVDRSAIKTIPLFASLSDEELDRVLVSAREVSISSGTPIVERWDYGRDFFLLLDGSAEVRRPDGQVAAMGPGDFFGELAALDWGASFGYPRLATVTASSPVRLLVIAAEPFNALVAASPEVASQIQQAIRQRLPGL
ncbi:MAG: aromatic-L-amino-acid/L-tryptophan decarboxylase [Chloroflexota bacterium]|jgi:glutamate/tyrosine decarboxylase-like PLP-dependent enzyme|nr:aromatic-L-amino-acid/L-tryptophan decarboxylase [Chloroflexota bacterium]